MTTSITDTTRKGAVLLALLFLAILADPIHAAPATRIWIGKEDPFWSNPGNWTNGLVPVAGDSIEFLDDVKFRDTYNDLDPDMTFGSLHIKGRNYVLRGNKINLQDNIISQPSNSSTLITLDLNINAPLSIVNYGYFNVLELAGVIRLYWHPLVLETSSSILISGSIINTNDSIMVIQRASGTLSFSATGRLGGTMVVEQGELVLGGASANVNLYGTAPEYSAALIVGRDVGPPADARVSWRAANKLADYTAVNINRSGLLDLNGFSQTMATLSGSGVVNLDGGQLRIQGPAPPSNFAGELRGNGALQVAGAAGFELSGHNTFTGSVEVALLQVTNAFTQEVSTLFSELNLSGSASNAAVRLQTNAVLRGKGVARSLTATNATIRPGPGALRFLEGFSLDAASTLDLDLDGPDAAMIEAGSIDLGEATLQFTYRGAGPESLFTLISANFANAGSVFGGLAEGAWLVAGDPGAPSEFRLTYSANGGHDVVLERTGLFVRPPLNIRMSGTECVIEWPLSAPGYLLERATSLIPADWSGDGLPAPAATVTDFFIIDNSAEGERFYRLKR